MRPIDRDLYRVLFRRIESAVAKAKWHPGKVPGWDGPAIEAEKVLRPWAPPGESSSTEPARIVGESGQPGRATDRAP